MIFKYNSMSFLNIEKMKSPYNNKDIYISKLKFLNMKYLLEEEEKYDILIISCRNKNIYKSALHYKNNNSIETDLSSLNIKFDEISNIQFGHLKYKSNSYYQ